MAKISAERARELSKLFFNLSVRLANFRFDKWDHFGSKSKRDELEMLESRLRNLSSNFTAIAITATVTELEAAIKDINRATRKATRAVRNITTVKNAIALAASAVSLAGGILSGNPMAIASATIDLANAADAVVS